MGKRKKRIWAAVAAILFCIIIGIGVAGVVRAYTPSGTEPRPITENKGYTETERIKLMGSVKERTGEILGELTKQRVVQQKGSDCLTQEQLDRLAEYITVHCPEAGTLESIRMKLQQAPVEVVYAAALKEDGEKLIIERTMQKMQEYLDMTQADTVTADTFYAQLEETVQQVYHEIQGEPDMQHRQTTMDNMIVQLLNGLDNVAMDTAVVQQAVSEALQTLSAGDEGNNPAQEGGYTDLSGPVQQGEDAALSDPIQEGEHADLPSPMPESEHTSLSDSYSENDREEDEYTEDSDIAEIQDMLTNLNEKVRRLESSEESAAYRKEIEAGKAKIAALEALLETLEEDTKEQPEKFENITSSIKNSFETKLDTSVKKMLENVETLRQDWNTLQHSLEERITQNEGRIESLSDVLDTFQQNFQDGLSKISGAITENGIAAQASATPDELAANIGELAAQKYAEGIQDTKVGTAVQKQVLAGCTFTNVEGVGIAGMMVDNGSLEWKPEVAETYVLAEGYYSGGILDTTPAYEAGYKAGMQQGAYKKYTMQDWWSWYGGDYDQSEGWYYKNGGFCWSNRFKCTVPKGMKNPVFVTQDHSVQDGANYLYITSYDSESGEAYLEVENGKNCNDIHGYFLYN